MALHTGQCQLLAHPILSMSRGATLIFVKQFSAQVWRVYWQLLRLMVPTLVVVHLLDQLGATVWLGRALGPVMALVGLPDAAGVVWAAVLLTNLYTGLVIYFALVPGLGLTVAQATVLGVLMLVAHSLPVEAGIARAAGVPWRVTLVLRAGGALLLGAVLNQAYRLGGWLQQPVQLAWAPPAQAASLAGWLGEQLMTLAWILVVLVALMGLLRLLRALGIERLMHALLAPVLRVIGLGREAAGLTIVGVTLGITFGAGLLLQEVRSGRLTRREVWLALGFLGLAHSLIEDTLLVMLMGADLSGILWARLGFAIGTIALLARLPVWQGEAVASPEAGGGPP
ncbi:MAG: hypothetical protein KDG55_13915 [Rhodocyclaceae bacterium]|nr:hypothetical protein [Rhodocyclaceae bacterium]